MRIDDYKCDACGLEAIDLLTRDGVNPSDTPCACGGYRRRTLLSKPAYVISDELVGGYTVRHGLCDEVTGEPKTYYYKSEMRKEAKRRGLINFVEHSGAKGSSKSEHTSRWV
jgi:hypothetical protein